MSYFDRDGAPIDGDRHYALSHDRKYVRVGATELKSEGEPSKHFHVSTVWTGMDTGSREIFESLVSEEGAEDRLVKYRTYPAALAGHNSLVGECMGKLGPGPKLVREIPAEET
ncbi:hypothetical protein [Streptomyces sp. NPDC017448]|uniref:hypothetical protein n=1 Tax=Streptomyces sp. NPDC017448 TaxID=3364996 RepID=UPI0037B1B2C8